MSVKPRSNEFAAAICQALGLTHVTKLKIELEVGGAPVVTVVSHRFLDGEVADVLQRFELTAVERPSNDSCTGGGEKFS